MRDFAQTPEPAGTVGASGDSLSFVIQKHAARSLHYDFRLELDGTLKSWAVPKGPSLDPSDKRMAVHVEDHPISYGSFEGTIPPGHYGAGNVIVWDRGTWTPLSDPDAGLRAGKLKFELHGSKLHGRWALVRMRRDANARQEAWLLMKEADRYARPADEFKVVEAQPDSVLSASSVESVAVTPSPTAAPAAKAPRRPRAAAPQRAALPERLAPELATLVDHPPAGDDWLYEVKFDGYRLLTRVQGAAVHCFTRNGHDWSAKLPRLVAAIKKLKLESAWLDGEIVVADDQGRPDFQALQNAFDTHATSRIRYHLFDLPFHAGRDLRAQPVEDRRASLQALLKDADADVLRFSEAFDQDPKALLESMRSMGLEGLIGKRKGSPYTSARSGDWIKLKTAQRQEFVIGGFTEPKGARQGVGSLLLGVHEADGTLRHAGNVGTGFDEKTLAALRTRLDKLVTQRAPFAKPPARAGARKDMLPTWVKPTLLAEVSFAQWTRDGHVRHAVFHGLRNDKPASRITREPVKEVAAVEKAKGSKRPMSAVPADLRITHPDRVIDQRSGVTKGELVAFYASVSALMLPHLRARPIAMLRAPSGVDGSFFFQKHAEATQMPDLQSLDPALDPGHAPLLVVPAQRGLLAAAQLNVIEFHTWNATATAIARPDRIVFDLDPGTGVDWPQVQEAAQLLHGFLDQLGLKSFLKTSGGKGLHLVVPLAPRHDWAVLKAFAQAIVQHVAKVIPDRFVAKSGPKNRVGKIYIDYLRNGFGATTVCAWSARARPGMGVSVPLAWDELGALSGADHWTVRNIAPRLAVGNAPWAAYAAARQGLAAAMKKMAFDPKAAAA